MDTVQKTTMNVLHSRKNRAEHLAWFFFVRSRDAVFHFTKLHPDASKSEHKKKAT